MKRTTVLVTAAGGNPALNIIRALRKSQDEVRIVGADIDSLAAGLMFCDARYVVPRASDPAFSSEILQICKEESVRFVFPGFSSDYIPLSKRRNEFESEGVFVAVSSVSTLETCWDKWKTWEFLELNEILAPRTYLPPALPDNMNFPVLVKPRTGSGSKSATRINSAEELKFFLKYIPEPVVQEFVEGTEYTVDMLCYPEGKLVAGLPRARLVVRGGMAVRCRAAPRKDMVNIASVLAEKLGLVGICNIQFIDSGGKPHLIEINARAPAGGLPLTVHCGYNLPLMLVRLASGLPVTVPPIESVPDDIMVRYYEEKFVQADGTVYDR